MSNDHLKSIHQRSVERFHELCGDPAPGAPTEPSLTVRILRAKLILEEAFETIRDGLGVDVRFGDLHQPITSDALGFGLGGDFNLVETIDGCCDLRYVATGTLSACGVPDIPFQDAVDQNNLDKFGTGHTLREDGKLIKPPGHQPPDIAGILESITTEQEAEHGGHRD